MPAIARSLALLGALTLLAACGGGADHPAAGGTDPSSASAAASTSTSTGADGGGRAAPPAIVAVSAGGAVVTLNPVTGAVTRTLVGSGAVGDQIAVARGRVYFTSRHGCTERIEAVPAGGGKVTTITNGSLAAISPDGSKIAFARQPLISGHCVPAARNLVPLYSLVVRTFGTGRQKVYPMEPAGPNADSLPAPISHLSWAADGRHLAVSIAAVQDNEGWNLALVDTARARYYLSGAGISYVPATGAPDRPRSYLREGVYLPDGNLFVSRACCGGFPVHNTSRLMWEVNPSGGLVRQVAIGYANLEHTSLDASPDGRWLLYLAGRDLYVSPGTARPHLVARGLAAAAWE